MIADIACIERDRHICLPCTSYFLFVCFVVILVALFAPNT